MREPFSKFIIKRNMYIEKEKKKKRKERRRRGGKKMRKDLEEEKIWTVRKESS